MQSHLYNTPKPPHLVKPDIPEPLSLAIMQMLANNPDERPQDAESARLVLEVAALTL